MIKYFLLAMLFLVFLVITIGGFRGGKFTETPIEIFPDMDHQPKVKAQVPSAFFADGQGNRRPVPGTVPYEPTGGDRAAAADPMSYRASGMMEDGRVWGTGMPFEMTKADLMRGAERYAINCAICHGASGHGDGVIKEYGLSTIVTLLDERLREMPDGEIFNTITHGKNTMGAYGYSVEIDDRWRIIAYMRTLQRSQGTPANELPAELQDELAKLSAPAEGEAAPPAEGAEPAETEAAAAAGTETPTTQS
ncbi:MAG: cytochrome c [Verrucomicrobiota bacterium]